MGKLDGRVALISGGARGQGAAMARVFTAEGARVVIGDVLDDQGRKVAAELGDAARYVHLDVRDADQWAAAVAAAREAFGRLDALVNNAGVVEIGTVDEMPADAFMRVVEVNQLGVFLGTQAAVPALREAGGGTVVNISSVDGLIGLKYLSAYCASKFAVVGMTRVAAMELGPDGIRVNAVCPGVIRTDMTKDLHEMQVKWLHRTLPLRRFGEADETASVALFLTSDDSSYVTGTEVVVDGGWIAGHLTP
ncbi:3alpha(or 20beta)-hydroxysteroid dehydrogenase [Streptomyces misionensis]|uniref:3alpha(Or 20beta)-hydroxysteroid dehydrogenase n=1 Tax=Streptomyces misionensis TaxID=67331 RepID=A0A1H4IA12_9ACTN|nr:glucose 1-dehydrogenase [Streptomyces misionensis]SEB30831.1 3alpha(or 20beta)-hydroxysteroid dehydrogenase [Streptomyces misionensis]